jgi:hypothetical protein
MSPLAPHRNVTSLLSSSPPPPPPCPRPQPLHTRSCRERTSCLCLYNTRRSHGCCLDSGLYVIEEHGMDATKAPEADIPNDQMAKCHCVLHAECHCVHHGAPCRHAQSQDRVCLLMTRWVMSSGLGFRCLSLMSSADGRHILNDKM